MVLQRNQGIGNPTGFSWSTAGCVAPREAALNRRVVSACLRIPDANIAHLQQEHSTRVVRRSFLAGAPHAVSAAEVPRADAHWTTDPGLYLAIVVADCCPVFICNAAGTVVAAVHAGWRGTAGNIVGSTVSALIEAESADPALLRAWIGPCASADAYEVGVDVALRFERYPTCIISKRGRYFLDIPGVLRSQLRACGLPDRAISGTPAACTMSDARFHSYRRDGVWSGRMVALCGIRNEL